MKCVYLHVPKCAGVSVRSAIIAAYGRDRIFWDYSQNPANPLSEASIDPIGHRKRFALRIPSLSNKIIALGHFDINKYAPMLGKAKFITILRHPVDRLLSHYHYWHKNIDSPKFTQHPIRNHLLKYNLSIIEFAQIPSIQRFYTDIMFKDFSMSCFDLISTVEQLSSDQSKIEDICSATLDIGFENQSPRPDACSNQQITQLEEILRSDIEFYEHWTKRSR